jgi:AcrR family transcriptional regulator
VTSVNEGAGAAGERAAARRALVEKEILDRAAELFAERGYTGTSLQDVAEALGMSRTALYYYMASKEVILGRLVENLSARNARTLDAVGGHDGPPAQKLRQMAREIAYTAGSNPEQTRILTENRHHLTPDIRAAERVAERSILRAFEGVIVDGVHAGVFRAVDPRSAALSIVGMCVWTAWWVSAPERRSIEEIAEQVADQAVLSILMGDCGVDRADPRALLMSVRGQLEELQHVLGE